MNAQNSAPYPMLCAGRCFIIAEAGVNHNGSPDLALDLISAAFNAGADAVKFQTFTADKLVRQGTQTVEYQKANAGYIDQHAMLKQLELDAGILRRLSTRCGTLGIEFMSTPFDEGSADLLLGLGMQILKIPSGELTNHPLLEHLAATDRQMILSTGMATLEEVSEAVEVIKNTRRRYAFTAPLAEKLTLLHCTSNYPTAMEDVNLRAMHTLREHFALPAGYSDHTAGILVPVAAVALGAHVIEKHFTLDRKLPGPDHQASIEPGEFTEMVAQIRAVERSLGDGRKTPRKSEAAVRKLVRRSIVVARDLQAGHIIGLDDVTLLRPGTGLAPRDLPQIVGQRARTAIPKGTLLDWSHLA